MRRLPDTRYSYIRYKCSINSIVIYLLAIGRTTYRGVNLFPRTVAYTSHWSAERSSLGLITRRFEPLNAHEMQFAIQTCCHNVYVTSPREYFCAQYIFILSTLIPVCDHITEIQQYSLFWYIVRYFIPIQNAITATNPKHSGEQCDFVCESDHMCVWKSWLCDGESDCSDGSDEKGCECDDDSLSYVALIITQTN